MRRGSAVKELCSNRSEQSTANSFRLLAYFLFWDVHNYSWVFLSRINKHTENGGKGGFSNSEKKMGKTSTEMKYSNVISLELQIKTGRIDFFLAVATRKTNNYPNNIA